MKYSENLVMEAPGNCPNDSFLIPALLHGFIKLKLKANFYNAV